MVEYIWDSILIMLTPRPLIFDTYWRTAAERQSIFFNKLQGIEPYSDDPIFQTYKFCNVYRASDRVSQFLIRNGIYGKQYSPEDTLFRIFLFRLLNRNQTWVALEKELGEISLKTFTTEKYNNALERIKKENNILYGNACILCASKAFI